MNHNLSQFALAVVAFAAAPAVAAETPAESTPAFPVGVSGTQVLQAQPAPAQPGATQAVPAPAAPAPKFTYGGQADFYFEHNFNEPVNGKNQFRAFDVFSDQGPHLGLVDLWGQYARDPIGGRLDVDFGTTARLVGASDPSNARHFWEHIQQAYVSANLDGKKGRTYVDAGKWVTTAGLEVIEPHDNWLYTRSFLFNYAVPFYHVGVRGYHYFNDADYVGVAVHRGWNAVGDPGHGPGFALMGQKQLTTKWQFIGNYYGGEESPTAKSGKGYRNLFDLIANYNASKEWAYSFNLDFDQQGNSTLVGAEAQAKWQFHPKQYVALRGEFLADDGFLGTDLYSLSGGYTYTFNKYFQTRAEYRTDFGSGRPFAGNHRLDSRSSQPTFLISAIVSY